VDNPFLILTAISGKGMRVASRYGAAPPYEPEQIADAHAYFTCES
jgi:hypothetical protein